MKINRREAIGTGVIGLGLLSGGLPAMAGTADESGPIRALRVCGLKEPLALGDLPPRFSWQLDDGMAQKAYRVTVAATGADLAAGRNLLWDSGRVESSAGFDIAYGGAALPARSQAFWRVEVWPEGAGRPLRSSTSSWETGLGDNPRWQGEWLASESETARRDRKAGIVWITGTDRPKVDQPRLFRTVIESAGQADAELLVSAHRLDGVWFNGEPAVAAQDDPVAWTQMAVYPLRLRAGRNVIAIAVTRKVGFGVPQPYLAAMLRHGPGLGERRTGADGWRTSLEAAAGWQAADFDDSAWETAFAASSALPVGEPWPAGPACLLRRGFTIDRPIVSARLYATALGFYEPWLNGRKIGTERLTPDFTDPSDRLVYQAWDVTGQLRQGENVIGLWVGEGWYGGKVGASSRYIFGPAPCRVMAQLEITHADGSREILATGDGWEIADSPVVANSIYDGEVHDARLEQAGWAGPAAPRDGWRKAETIATRLPAIEPQRCPPIRAHGILRPLTLRKLGAGRYVADFGQNFAGWPRLSIRAPRGTRIEMRFAETIAGDGGVDQANLRTAWQRDVYITAGKGREVWEPRFTYHGFRYVELRGVPDKASSWSIEALVGHQDLAVTGDFRTADPVIRKFWENSLWSQKSNFFGLPTDCPQRDERLGWMGDAQVFWPAAAYNMDVAAFTARIMEDVRHAQKPGGAFPDCIPPYVPGLDLASPGWADAGIVLPYTAWMQYGDTGIIAANWTAMDRYMAWIARANPNNRWVNGRGADYGDWLAVDSDPKNPGKATTPKDLIGTALWAANSRMMSEMADALGLAEDAERYRALFTAIAQAFNEAYVAADGKVGNGSQTGYVLAIRFGLLSPTAQAEAGRRLAADIARRGNSLSTGFLGTPHILDALAMSSHADVAVTLLLQRNYPSWGYMVTKGATTMWERWNSDTGDVGMNSLNHYAFGAIGAFLFRRIAGIAAAQPGFRRIEIAPIMDARLGGAGATYHSISGTIRTDWAVRSGRFTLDVELPAGVPAEVVLPDGRRAAANGGRHRFSGRLASSS